MWKQYREHIKGRYKAPTYESFRRYINLLKKLSLIRPVKTVAINDRPGWTRVYYGIAPRMEDSPAWRNPYKHRRL